MRPLAWTPSVLFLCKYVNIYKASTVKNTCFTKYTDTYQLRKYVTTLSWASNDKKRHKTTKHLMYFEKQEINIFSKDQMKTLRFFGTYSDKLKNKISFFYY